MKKWQANIQPEIWGDVYTYYIINIYILCPGFMKSWHFYDEIDEVEQIRAAGPQEEIFKVPNLFFLSGDFGRERCGKNRIFQLVLQAFDHLLGI